MNNQKRLLISKILMVVSIFLFLIGLTFVYLAQHPKTLTRFLHLMGFNSIIIQSEEK